MAKDLNELKWAEDLLPLGYRRKPMFGGFAYYLDERMLLVIFENPGDRTHKDKTYPFDLWNGCMFPAEREVHPVILKKYPVLVPHPVLPKWLYLPIDTENFESIAESILKEIRARSKFFGVIPQGKKKNKSNSKKSEALDKIDTRRPRMFGDAPIEETLKKANRISDLKNFGPATEKTFEKAGIKTVNQFVKLGWKKAMQKLVKSNPKNRHSLFAYAVIGALKNIQWNGISDADKLEAREFCVGLKPAKKK